MLDTMFYYFHIWRGVKYWEPFTLHHHQVFEISDQTIAQRWKSGAKSNYSITIAPARENPRNEWHLLSQ